MRLNLIAESSTSTQLPPSVKFRKPLLKNRINRVPMGGRRGPGFGPAKCRGFRGLDSRPAAGSQRPFG